MLFLTFDSFFLVEEEVSVFSFASPYFLCHSLYSFVLLSLGIGGVTITSFFCFKLLFLVFLTEETLVSAIISPYFLYHSLYTLVLLSLGIGGIVLVSRIFDSDEDFSSLFFESFIKLN